MSGGSIDPSRPQLATPMRQWMETFRKERPEPFLFVLDDIWAGSESMLESFQSAMSNHKILVTSRSEFPRFSSKSSKSFSYQLKLLNDDEAIKLFYHTALGDERSSIKEELSRKIVKRFKGYPLAIKVVGRSLCGEPSEVWKERESEWSKGSSTFLDPETDLLICLQRSLEAPDKAFPRKKDCFLDLGCFPEDKKVQVGDLVDMWAELYNTDDDVVFAYVHNLCNRNLATLGDERMDGDDYYGKRFVTQHDLLRQLAIYETRRDNGDQIKRILLEIRGNNMPKWWKEQKCQPTNARLVSITTDGQFSTEWPQIQLPEAEVLVLDFNEFRYALPEFVKMDKLKVLIIGSRYSSFQLENLKLLQYLPNLKRMSLSNIPIENITKNPIQLKSLKKISLYSCHSEASFEKGDGTMSDAFPNLEELNIDCCVMSEEMLVGFCTLIHLKKLSIFSDVTLYRLPKEIGNLVNLEVLRIRDCTEVSKFSGSIKNLKKLSTLDLSGCFEIQLPEDIGELSSLRELHMRSCYQVFHLPRSVAKLHQLEKVICDELKNPLWEAIPTLTKLKKEPQNYGPGHSAALEKVDQLLKQFVPEWFNETWQK